MVKYLEKLIEQGEHQMQDFKFCVNDSRKIAKTISAFANTDGGRLLIGVKDNGKVAGIKSDEEYYMIQSAAELFTKPSVRFESNVINYYGNFVLEIYIPKSEERPHFAKNEENKWVAYIRKRDENFPANKILLKVWKNKKMKKGLYVEYTDIEKKLLDFIDKNGSITVNKFSRLVKISRRKAENILVKLVCWDVIDLVINDKAYWFVLK
jgi:predicted HTH transcriptional regulator